MGTVIANYVGLLLAFLLPVVGFQLMDLPRTGQSLVAIGAIGATLVVVARLARKGPTSPDVARHVGNQTRILWLFVLGGLLGCAQVFLFYEQFRLRFDLGVPLQFVSALLWVYAAWLIVSGLADALRHAGRRTA